MTTAFDLLGRGYFPKELPPPFSTADFANRVVGSIGPMPSFFGDPKRSELCSHNFARIGRLRRVLGIPNPMPQYALATLIENNWDRLDRLIRRSRIGASFPSPGRDRALVPGDSPLNEARARIRANARVLVSADVARFYHSVYTHTISWAVHGKKKAKEKKGWRHRRMLGNRLDEAVANCQDGQTVGLPVGPDTSLVLAEIVASAVDTKLQKAVRDARGVRFIDDYELPCRSRREADEILEALYIALADFELALNPLKTTTSDLPLPIDQLWKTPIRTSTVRKTPREQATDLFALFDMAYSLSHQYPDKSVLAYAIGRLADENICAENAALFQRLAMQCMLAEPGTSAVVLERFAKNEANGIPVDRAELAGVLNDQVVEHGPLGHSNEVAWALWGALIFDLKIVKPSALVLSAIDDSVVALLALHLKDRGLMHMSLDTSLWESYLVAEELYGRQWLLSYEAHIKGWLSHPSGIDHVGADACFKWLRDLGVEFYDVDRASPIAAGPDWLADLEEELQARRSEYGEPEQEADLSVNSDVGIEF